MCVVKCLVFVVIFNFISAQKVPDVETGDNRQYQVFPVSGELLHFKVRARNDAHIALLQHPQETYPMYEVVIGGWGNSKSAIRIKVCSHPEKHRRETPLYLNNDIFRSFWVKWDMGVTVGREGEETPFLSWRDPDPISIDYVGFHTGFGSSGVWNIKNVSTTDKKRAYEEYELKTGDNVKYEYFTVSGNTLRFKVRASNDAHIALTSHPLESVYPIYEIVIGGWANSKSAIRRRYCDERERDAALTSQYLDEKEFRGFWARWSNGIVLVGRDGEASPFLSWHDPEPFKVSFVGVHTGYGSTGTWKFDNVETGDNLQYQFFPVSGELLHFKVRARNDAHIAFSQHPQDTYPMYQVVIGGWGNSKSAIRSRVCSHSEKERRETPQYLNNDIFRSFWVKWDMGVLTVGREGEETPFLSWRDPDPISIDYVGFHTGFGSSGVWNIKNVSTTDKKRAYEEYELKTGDNVKYEYFTVSGNTVRFKVRASNDAHIALTARPLESVSPIYEIVIGGWANSKSAIRRRYCEERERDIAVTSQYLDDKEFRGFWARWKNGIVLVGRDGEASPFLSWHDPDPFNVSFIGVHTGFGSTGTWKIDSTMLLAPKPAPPVCVPTLTRLRQGTACAGQVIFEENFDTLREDVWQVQQYVPIDHPELPFVSYQRHTVSVNNGHLRITPALQQIQPGFTQNSMYGSLDLYNGCTSGQSSSCKVVASDGYAIIPPIIGGRISSKSTFAFTYGIISVRAKLPQGDWLYPEILLEPLSEKFAYGTKNSGMLKIACARGNKDLNKGSTQYGNKVLYSGPVIDTTCHDTLLVTTKSDTNWGDDFHVYSVKWTPEQIIMLVDGVEYGRLEAAAGGLRARLPKACAGPQQKGMAPFDDHFYITLGLAAGGHTEFPDACVLKDNHAKPWKNHASKAILRFWYDIDSWHDTWELPKFIIDYVKVVAL